MAKFPRSLSPLARVGTTGIRGLRCSLALAALASLAAISFAAPAGAVVTKVGSLEYGIQPETAAAGISSTPLVYGGGEVVHSNAPYAIYWDPADVYSGRWQSLTSGFLKGIGTDSGTLKNVTAVATQYRDATHNNASSSSAFHGAYTDVEPYETGGETAEKCSVGARCVTDAQIRAQLTKYMSANPQLPTGLNPSGRPTPIYFVFTPPNVTVCLDTATGYCSASTSAKPLCSYHSYVSVEGATVLYAVEPSSLATSSKCQDGTGLLQEPNKSLADIIVNGVADQLVATTTDPLLNGWHDGASAEIPDKCRNDFVPFFKPAPTEQYNQTIAGTRYYINDEFNQAALYEPYPGVACLNEVIVEPRFTAPNHVHSEEEVTLSSSESYIDLGIAKYHWDFGDETEPVTVDCGNFTPTNGQRPAQCDGDPGVANPNPVGSVKHKYTYAGTYNATLTITDDGGNQASFTEPVTVFGQARPQAAQGGAGAPQPTQAGTATPSSATAGAATGSTKGAGTAGTTHPLPLATAASVSRSLRSVLRSGLVIRYSVNEQVAGHFEVLLASSTARRIGLHGTAATGLPKGTAPQTVIARAILVTTRAGRSMVKIQFGKTTASRLRRLGKVSLMLRLVVRNGSTGSATILSPFTLSR
ncbi:MAG: hypothetical protein JWO23_1261 [Solirubrobacterales bacterium]|nr:hypothetical protein [Solirubrobacterales bacterium]